MRKISMIAIAGTLTLFLGSCTIGGGGGGQQSEEETEQTPTASPASPSPAPEETPFAQPLTPEQSTTPPAVAGLVQTLPPGARSIPQGRSNPFATIPVKPRVAVAPDAAAGGGGGRGGRGAVARARGAATAARNGVAGAGAAGAGNGAAGRGEQADGLPTAAQPLPALPQIPSPPEPPRPEGEAGSPGERLGDGPGFAPSLPALPEPTLARSIAVTGVIEVGGVTNAIVKEPNAPSRYVRVGQRLSNGQVLVKRIEVDRGPEPVVILEQFGVEVARRVGDRPEGSEPPGSA